MGLYAEAGIVLGFLVKRDEITEEFVDENWDKFIYLDCYEDDGDLIWSIDKVSPAVDWGNVVELSAFEEYSIAFQEYKEKIKEFEKSFPNRKGEEPKIYLYNSIC